MAETLVEVAVRAGGGIAAVVLVTAAVTRRVDIFAFGSLVALLAGIGAFQKVRGKPEPRLWLGVASTGCALVVPLIDRAVQLVILPSLTMLIVIGVLTLPKTWSRWFAIWNGVLMIVSLRWLIPDPTVMEATLALVLLAGVGWVAWQVVNVAGDIMIREQDSHRKLFHSSPVATLEEDFSGVTPVLDELREKGVIDLEGYLRDRPDDVRSLISLIKIRRANPAAVRMLGAESPEELYESLERVRRSDSELEPFVEQFAAVWCGRRELALDLAGLTIEGAPFEGVLHWSVPTTRGKPDLSRVIVTISDIAPRRVVEDQLAAALEANQQLLNFEHALASCSRALLLGKGDDAIDVALETLRGAIGSDRAYLTVNVADPQLGPSFRVVSSTSVPAHSEDPWVGVAVPWSKYPTAHDPMSRGEPFQHVGADEPGRGWSRSLLSVPIFVGDNWMGNVGFVDITRRTSWSDEAIRMLQVAAPMLGNYWERDVTRRRLEELVRSKDRFVASVSHELRTPLAAVLGFAEELRDSADSFQPQELTGMLELIADQSQEMANMVEDLLVSARADIGTISIVGQEVYLRSQAEATLAGLGSIGARTIDVVGGPGKVWADPSRTRQIIRNLLTNAVRYGGTEVTVEATELGERTMLSIRDNGPGLPEAEWERIFEPYERAHDTPTQPASIGLGLTVSRQLARLMDGDLTYESDGSSSVFKLVLPAAERDDRAGQAVPSLADSTRAV
jgi:signal transduction histidine kinase/PAS domain-containing protein